MVTALVGSYPHSCHGYSPRRFLSTQLAWLQPLSFPSTHSTGVIYVYKPQLHLCVESLSRIKPQAPCFRPQSTAAGAGLRAWWLTALLWRPVEVNEFCMFCFTWNLAVFSVLLQTLKKIFIKYKDRIIFVVNNFDLKMKKEFMEKKRDLK